VKPLKVANGQWWRRSSDKLEAMVAGQRKNVWVLISRDNKIKVYIDIENLHRYWEMI
jgi:hypothetical protein